MKLFYKIISTLIVAMALTTITQAEDLPLCDGQLKEYSSAEDVKFVLNHDKQFRLEVQADLLWTGCVKNGNYQYSINPIVSKDGSVFYSCFQPPKDGEFIRLCHR